ncbi:hypothetical protein [Candidatus Amarolinea aalborgensis]|uniref:hypothetical protein n=1 Tax=Candidatus Amarolinea aalborgensis TaxID=2249329 RepID=UPI003BF9CFDE
MVRALELVFDHDQVIPAVVSQDVGRKDASRSLPLHQGELGNAERLAQQVEVFGEPCREVPGFM